MWTVPVGPEATCGTVVAAGDRLFASGGYPESTTVCVSSDGELLWEDNVKHYEPSLLVVDQHLFGVTDNGIAHCWAIADGQLRWRERLGGNFSASPVLCNDRIYVPNLSGETFVFRVTGESYDEVAVNELGDDCYASPAMVGGEVFLRIGLGSGEDRQEQMVCIRSSNRE